MVLKFRHHNEIDKHTWDLLVEQSINGNIYCTSTYLDHMSPGWAAITDEDYSVGMALPLRKKWGISYIYPPFFTQQLGIIYTNEKLNLPVEIIIDIIPAHIKLIELNLNATNDYNEVKNSQIIDRKNYILSLNPPYEEILKKFSQSAKQNISKAKKNNVRIQENIAIKEIVEIHRKRFTSINIPSNDYKNFERLLDLLNERTMIYTCGAYADNQLIAGSVFIKYKDRITAILPGNSHKSLETGATYLSMKEVIQNFAGQNLKLDFEGSDNPNFARFFKHFGAVPEHYKFIRLNRLPYFLKWLKKQPSF